MKKGLRALALACSLGALFAVPISAQNWCNSTGTWWFFYDGTYSPYENNTCHGWTANGAGHVFGVNMYWNQAGRNGVQSYVDDGRRYTHDMTDLNANLTATGVYSTNLPSPYLDFDDDDGNGEWEEAEATVESAAFPVVERKYYLFFWFNWAGAAGNVGNIAYTPAISEELWWTSDKWDTYRFDKGLKKRYTKTGNLFEGIDKLPTERLFKENENEKQFERRKLSRPMPIDEFKARVDRAGVIVKGYALEYEVDSHDGPQIITIGMVPTTDEFLPQSTLEDVFATLPEGTLVNKLRGVVSYYFDPDTK